MAELVQPLLAVNASTGGTVPMKAASFCRYVEIQEDGSGAQQGITITWPNGNTVNYPPSQQPVCLGNKTGALGGATGPFVGVPAGWNGLSAANCPATVYGQVISMGAATELRITEWS